MVDLSLNSDDSIVVISSYHYALQQEYENCNDYLEISLTISKKFEREETRREPKRKLFR